MVMDLREDPAATTFSSAVLTEIPTETDVFYALSRPSPGDNQAAHYVITELWAFIVGQRGEIIAMPSEVFRNLRVTEDGRDVTTDPPAKN